MNCRFHVIAAAVLFSSGTLFAQSPASAVRSGTQQLTQREAAAYMEELSGSMIQQLKAVQDENAALSQRVLALEQTIAELADSNRTLKNELASAKRQITAISQANETTMKQISAQLDKLASTPAAVPASSTGKSKTSANPTPIDADSYQEFTVPAGGTLSAIAQACGTTVSELKRINNLKSDNLRVGQKLKIPVK